MNNSIGADTFAYTYMESSIGPIWIAATDRGLCSIGLGQEQPRAFLSWLDHHVGTAIASEAPALLSSAMIQWEEYLAGERRDFDLLLDIRGSAFRRAVWGQVAQVNYAATISYGDLARRVDRPRAARAVGAAVGANPLPIVIPCHRIVGSDGSLVGYAGGLEIKLALLELERAHAA